MKVAGIVTEYNPFHNGHLYHIRKTKEVTGADYLIVIMSGDFTQRGLPAFADKYLRAKTALLNGADLVLELPVNYACHSAEFFALGSVSLLHSLGIVTDICFGSECGDLKTLSTIAALLANEPEAFQDGLKLLLKDGYTYPQARTLALSNAFPNNKTILSVLQNPNNILGIEYLKALISLKSNITPHTILREGCGYHDVNLDSPLSSAFAIRSALQKDGNLSFVKNQLPESSFCLLNDYLTSFGSTFADDFSSILYYKLLTEQPTGYESYLDVSNDLSNRIRKNLNNYISFSHFADLLKTKELTHTRITRCLTHIFLNLKKEKTELFISNGISYYARILAFQKEKTELLSALKKHSNIPLISKLSIAKNQLSEIGFEMLSQDIFASSLYHSILCQKFHQTPISEYERSPMKL